MPRTFIKGAILATAIALGAAASGTAFAGEQYVDGTGFAVSGYDVVAYHGLTQAPVGQSQPAPVPGKAGIVAEYNGAKWAFASEANKAAFLADPARYVPAYDGHCAYGIAQGGKVPANPQLWRIRDGKLYLNINRDVVGFWEADIPGNLKQSTANWPKLEPAAAADTEVPEFDATLAPTH
ncbi:MAG: YHS domain-containing (seleno)protein [Pseudomonadota bacterium]|nr:YHS domain-containing (seleno)protein [Pseudomonadota bacterium]